MSTATIAAIIDQVKLDVLSKTQATDNANKRKEISRTFICETRTVGYLLTFLLTFYPADTVTGWALRYLIYLSIMSQYNLQYHPKKWLRMLALQL